jgi:hypothetical protein
MEQMKQGHGIQPAGDGHQNRLSAFEEEAVLDVFFNALEQIGHAPMLLHPGNGARPVAYYGNRRMR